MVGGMGCAWSGARGRRLMAQEQEQEWGPNDSGDDTDRNLLWSEGCSCDGVGGDEEHRAKEGRDWQYEAVAPADEAACQMGYDESDEADTPDSGHDHAHHR